MEMFQPTMGLKQIACLERIQNDLFTEILLWILQMNIHMQRQRTKRQFFEQNNKRFEQNNKILEQ